MKWTKTEYPADLKKLPEDVREKAIEIGNDLMEQKDMDEKKVVSIATRQALDWQAKNEKDKKAAHKKKEAMDKQPDVIPTASGWVVPKQAKTVKVKSYDEDVSRIAQTKKSHPPIEEKIAHTEIRRRNETHNR